MSHLIKKNKKVLKFLRISFYILILTMISTAIYSYKGNKINIALFGLLSNLIFIFIFSKKAYFFEIFFGGLLWLGFWYKYYVIILFRNYAFFEGAGIYSRPKISFDQKLNILDNALNVAMYGIAGFLLACLIKNKFLKDFYNLKKTKIKDENIINSNFLLFVILVFIITFLIITFSNFFLGIYQRGILATFDVHFIISAVYKWLLLFGFSSFIAFSFIFTLRDKSKIYLLSIVSIIETFLTNISFLSRGMIFNLFAIFIGLYKSNKFFKLNLNIKFFLIYLSCILIFFYISVASVNYLRANIFFAKNDPKKITTQSEDYIFENRKKYNTHKSAFLEFINLSQTRWVGIDALVAVSAYDQKSFDLFKASFKDKFDKNKLPFYERIIQNRKKNLDNKTVQYGITTPGIFAFLYYTGSKVFVFQLIFVISLIFLTIERYIFVIFKNLILCSVLSQVLAYRLIHFGYMPQNTYLLLSSFLLTIIGLIVIKKFFFKN